MNRQWVWLAVVGLVCAACACGAVAQAAPAKSAKQAKAGRSASARDQVAKAATALKKQGLYKGDVSGKWSPELHAAVEAFQKSHGLKETGRLNKETRKALGIDQADLAGAGPGKGESPDARPDP